MLYCLRTLLIVLIVIGLSIFGGVHAGYLGIVLLRPRLVGIEVNRVGRDVTVIVPDGMLTWQTRAFWFAFNLLGFVLAIALAFLLRHKPACRLDTNRMRFCLRTLLIVLAIGPPIVASSIYTVLNARQSAQEAREKAEKGKAGTP